MTKAGKNINCSILNPGSGWRRHKLYLGITAPYAVAEYQHNTCKYLLGISSEILNSSRLKQRMFTQQLGLAYKM
jgi:hypothetical protein